jgi:integrase
MARNKVFKHETLVSKCVRMQDDNQRGILRFQFLKLPVPFRSELMSKQRVMEYAKRVAQDIKMLETVPADPTTETKAYPFSTWQISWIEETGHTLLPEVQSAFTVATRFRDVWDKIATKTMKEQIPSERFKRIKFADKDMSQVTGKDIADLYKDILTWNNFITGRPLEGSTKRSCQIVIRTVFNHAENNDLIVTNAFKKNNALIKKHALPNYSGKKTYRSFIQLEFYYAAAAQLDARNLDRINNPDTWKNVPPTFWHAELFARFGVFTGARSGDLLEATWNEFDYIMTDRCRWTFRQRKHKSKPDWHGKSGDKYDVEISDFHANKILLEMLREKYEARKSDDEKVFRTTTGKTNSIKSSFNLATKMANETIEQSDVNDNLTLDDEPVEQFHWTIHEMRHTMVAQFISGSFNWDAASKRCGHSKVSMTMDVYGDMMAGAIKLAEDKKNEFILKEEKRVRLRIRKLTTKLKVVK